MIAWHAWQAINTIGGDMGKTLFLQIDRDKVPPQVILVGAPERVHLFALEMDNATVRSTSREFTFLTGRFHGLPIGVASTGIGAPAIGLVLEELAEAHVRHVLRAGTMIALNGEMGNFVLAQGAARYEGVSSTYAPSEIPAIPDETFFRSAWQTLSTSGEPFRAGPVATVDAFYRHIFPDERNGRQRGELLRMLRKHGLLAADMETSALYVIGRTLGMRTQSLCLLSVSAFPWNSLAGESRDKREKTLVRLALEVMYNFVEGES